MRMTPALGAVAPTPSLALPPSGLARMPRQAAPAAPIPAPAPRLRLEPALGLVVLEFQDSRGQVAETIPNARQLAAYRARPPSR